MRSLIGGVLNRTPVPFASPAMARMQGFFTRNDQTAQLAAMGSVGTVFSIVDRIASTVAGVNWHLYRSAASGREEDREEVTRHAALTVWNNPNQFFTRQELVEASQQHFELVGEGPLVVGRDPRITFPTELWPVRPDRLAPVPSPTEFLTGYIYTGPDGEKVPLGLEDVVLQRRPNPLDAYRGMGPVQTIMVDLDSARYTAEWNRNFFINSAEPGGLIQVEDGMLTDTEFDTMMRHWRESHQGVSNAHRVAIIERGKWVSNSFSMKDMQFAELRVVSRDVIMEAFGVSKPMLGITDDVNRANAEAGEAVFAKYITVPRLERWKQLLNHDFLPMFGTAGQGLEFDYDNPVPENAEAENADRTSKTGGAKNLVEAGWHPDDVTQAMGLPPMRYVGQPTAAASTAPAEEG